MKAKNMENIIIEAKTKYEFHKKEMQKWETFLKAYNELKKETSLDSNKSATEQAIEIAEEMLNRGLEIKTTAVILEEINKKGIRTRSGRPFNNSVLSSILGQSGRVIYNREKKLWELVNH